VKKKRRQVNSHLYALGREAAVKDHYEKKTGSQGAASPCRVLMKGGVPLESPEEIKPKTK
jgi:hypothetical protein